jgi:hypothetical protein
MNATLNFQDQDGAQVAEPGSPFATNDCPASGAPTSNAAPTAEQFTAQTKSEVLEIDAAGMNNTAAPSDAGPTSPARPDTAANNAEQVVRHPLVQPAMHNTPTPPVAALQCDPYDTSAAVSPAHAQALLMASHGHPVFPLYGIEYGKCTCGNATCADAGKHPRRPNSFKEATTNPTIINTWFKYEPELNYGVRLGQEMGNTRKMVVVVDVDRYKVGGAEALEVLENVHGRLPETVEVLTGGGR